MKDKEKVGKSKLSSLVSARKYFKRHQRELEIKKNIRYWRQKLRELEEKQEKK